MNRATLQRICLGVEILAGDAHFIQFTEEGSREWESAPDYIVDSPWTVIHYDRITGYIHELWKDLSDAVGSSGYVNSVGGLEDYNA